MSEAGWWFALVFGGFGVPVLVYSWKRLGRVGFDPSDWRMGFWESIMPGLLFVGDDDNRASPDRAGTMDCSFSVKISNGKRVDTTLHQVTGVFHLPGGSTHAAIIHDRETGDIVY